MTVEIYCVAPTGAEDPAPHSVTVTPDAKTVNALLEAEPNLQADLERARLELGAVAER